MENLEKENVIRIHDIQLSLDPAYSAPTFEAVRGKSWIPYVNPDGEQYPDMLIALYNNSALHGAILQSKIDQVIGNGFVWDVDDAMDEETQLQMSQFMSDITGDGEDVNEIGYKFSNDLEIFGGIAAIITWTNDWTRIATVEHVDFSKIRAEAVDPSTGKIPGYWYSWDWSKQRQDKHFLPAFSTAGAQANRAAYKRAEQALKDGNPDELEVMLQNPTSQIFYYKPYRPGSFYYPHPDYVGAIAAIQTDILSDQYGVSSFENGLNTNVIVTMFGVATDEQKNKEAKKFLKMHTGAAKANKPIIAFAKDQNDALKVDPISNSKEDKLFMTINENTLQKILSGHRITDPVLVGIKSPGELGNSDLSIAIDFWNTTVIQPEQLVLTKFMNKVMEINELPEVFIEPLQLYVDPADEVEEEIVEEEDPGVGNEIDDEEEDVNMDKMRKGAVKGDIKKKHAESTKKKISESLKARNQENKQ